MTRYHVTLRQGDDVRHVATVRTIRAVEYHVRRMLGPHAKRCRPSTPAVWRAKGVAGEVRR